jgi:hypothetical protein
VTGVTISATRALPALLLAGLCAVLAREIRGKPMAMFGPQIKPIRELIEVAKAHSDDVPDEMRRSYPIPVKRAQGPAVVFLYATGRAVPGEGQYLAPPDYQATVDAVTGRFEGFGYLDFVRLGLAKPRIDAAGSIGVVAMPPGQTAEEFRALEQRLLDRYDALLPHYVADHRRVSAETLARAREFVELFEQVAEKPLQPYYRAVGKDFFAWLYSLKQ